MSISPPPSRSAPTTQNFHILDDAALEASIARSMTHWHGEDIWVFGYGSLVWRPEFAYEEARLARVHGYHRALCLWSRVNRGTPECPGLVFGLEVGGSCQGRVFRIDGKHVPDTMLALWRREMPSAAYIPRWLKCRTVHGDVQGLAFTMDRSLDSYAPSLPIDQLVSIIRQGHGRYGACTEYVVQTAHALEKAGIVDRRLHTIVQALGNNLHLS